MTQAPHHHGCAVWLLGACAGVLLLGLSISTWPLAPQGALVGPRAPALPNEPTVAPEDPTSRYKPRQKASRKAALRLSPASPVVRRKVVARSTSRRPARRKMSRRLSSRQHKQRVRACRQALRQMGVHFRPRRNPRARPWGRWGRRWRRCSRCQRCSVVGAVRVYPPIMGVDWINGYHERVPLFMRCELALAIARWSLHLRSQGIVRVMHFGTYHCKTMRKDKGYSLKLSQHGLGRAVDVAAFWDRQKTLYSLVKHWDHKTRWRDAKGNAGCRSRRFRSFRARRLYQIACDMWRGGFFSLILTPNFNRVHDDHFHMEAGYPASTGPGKRGELDGYRLSPLKE